jgi:hypothetical protein
MPEEKSKTPATDAVKALARFLHEPEGEAESREQIQAELKSAGIIVPAVIKTVRGKITQAKSRQRLALARERRNTLLRKVSELKSLATSGGMALRQKVKELLDQEFAGQTDAAVLFHKFEEAKDDDLKTLLDDILLLNADENEERSAS